MVNASDGMGAKGAIQMETSQHEQQPPPTPTQEPPRCPPRFRLIDDEEILREPDREFLIDGVCSTKSLVLTHGQSGHGKSFLGLDAAFSVASGGDWFGHAVKSPGPVIYIAAEGQAGLKDRVRAWRLHHGIEGKAVGVRFILEPVDPLNSDDVEALRGQLRLLAEKPKLVVVDTWSACLAAGTGDENVTKDTSRAVYAWRKIIEDVGATIWIIHHEGHAAQGRARGSSSLKAAAETEIGVSQKQGIVSVKNLKQRDDAEFDNLRLKHHVVPLGDNRNSCVLVAAESTSVDMTLDSLPERASNPLALLRLRERGQSKQPGTPIGLTYSEWLALTRQPEATFDRSRKLLLDRGFVEKAGEGKGALYRTTNKGRGDPHPQITPTETLSAGRPSLPPSPVTPRRGDGAGGDDSEDDASAETKASDSAANPETAP